MNHIRNIQFIVEGKTEGQANAFFGKGVLNILRDECIFMREREIRHSVLRKNGKYDQLAAVGTDVSKHLEPSKKALDKLNKRGSPVGDYVFILRDLDCEDEKEVHDDIFAKIDAKFHSQVDVHFAVQEIEAWMIADPDGFCSIYRHYPSALLTKLKRLVPFGQSPEEVLDCNPKPADRLERIVEKHGLTYTKTTEGSEALGMVNPDIIAERCPHFKTFRDSLREKIDYPYITTELLQEL